jgi:hypothetical protein
MPTNVQWVSGYTYLNLDGISVTLFRDEGTGQVVVSIFTEDATDPRDHREGEPLMAVYLNDAVLYDEESS